MKLPPGHVAGKGLVRPTGYGGYGEKMLKSMGWEKGQGLGRSSQGIKEAIQVKEKQDTTGVGGRSSWKWDDNWWERAFSESSASLNKLANTNSSSSGSDSSSSSDSDPSSSSSSSDSDSNSEEEYSAVQSSSRRNRDGTVSSASAQELALLAALTEAGSSRMAAGRFGGRAGKMARIRAQEEEAAKAAAAALGLDQGPPTIQSSAKGSSTTKSKEETPKAIIIEVGGLSEPLVPAGWKPTPAKGWWGASTFAPAGQLEGMRKQEKDKKKGFTEDDQENLYNAAQVGKSQGRVGLGQSQRRVKVGGQAWSGTRMEFADDDEEQGATTESDKRSIDSVGGEEEVKGSVLQSTWTAGIKWKTVTSRFLMDTPGKKSSLKKVLQHVLQHVQQRLETKGLGVVPADDEIMQILQDKLISSRQFILKGKKVRLAD